MLKRTCLPWFSVASLALGLGSCSSTPKPAPAGPVSSPAPASRPAPAPQVATTASPSPLDGAKRTFPEDPTLGSFQVRLQLSGTAVEEFSCIPGIYNLAGLDSGELWVTGNCGLRGRLTPSGFVDQSGGWKKRRRTPMGDEDPICWAYTGYSEILVRSPREIYVIGSDGCDQDPNTIHDGPLERFDGTRWSKVTRQDEPPVPTQLAAGASGPIYGLVSDGLPREEAGSVVAELVGGKFRVLRRGKLPDQGPWEYLVSMEVDASGALWISGARYSEPGSGPEQSVDGADRGSPFLWRYHRGKWTELAFEDKGSLSRDADGHLWLFGRSAWRETDGEWRRMEAINRHLRETSAVSAAARSERDVWWVAPDGLYHFDGDRVTSVPWQRDDVCGMHWHDYAFELAGPRTYLYSDLCVQELIAPGEAPPHRQVVELRPPPR